MATNYSNIADIQQWWIDNIAPKYWDMDNINQYKLGAFGYINEVMAVSDVDNFNATSVARREFYPNTAQYDKSLYKMAALHSMSLPIATPAVAEIALLLKEDELIERSTVVDGVREFILDVNAIIMAGKIQFMLDYPIKLTSPGSSWGAQYIYEDGEGNAFNNTLSTDDTKYLPTKVITQDGQRFVTLIVTAHQVTKTVEETSITKNSNLDAVTVDISYRGQLANFEVFYTEDNSSNTVQLKKLVLNSAVIQTPFCMYSYVDNNKIRLHFPSNAYFTPKFNSKIRVDIYTTLGEEGNFETYEADLRCSVDSHTYPYNNQISLMGITMGPSVGGVNTPDAERFREMICAAYATNNCFTSENDLQIYFDHIMKSDDNKIVFFKKRDDAFERLYGAFMLMKDSNGNVVPTNTLHMGFNESAIENSPFHSTRPTIGEMYDGETKIIIKPGEIFTYSKEKDYLVVNSPETTITDEKIGDTSDDFIYTNPYLICISKKRNSVGYFLNSRNDAYPLRYRDVNNSSAIQFLVNSLRMSRNAIIGENFYKIELNITASNMSQYLSAKAIQIPEYSFSEDGTIRGRIDINDKESNVVETGKIAKSQGYYEYNYIDENGVVYAVIAYTDDNGAITGRENIRISSNASYNEDDEDYEYIDGFTMNLNRGETFKAKDAIAYKKVHDCGCIRLYLEFSDFVTDEKMFVPLIIEDYNDETGHYTLAAYMRTDDHIYVSNDIVSTTIGGFHLFNGTISKDLWSVPLSNSNVLIHSFIKYDKEASSNLPHPYIDNLYVKDHTWTNTYELREDQQLKFMQPIDFLRSSLLFPEVANTEDDIEYTITQVPFVKAVWIRKPNNFKKILGIIERNYAYISNIYTELENNFSIDMKFFNTYGKSKFYKVGFKDTETILDRVDNTFKFGVKLTTLSPTDSFKTRFTAYVKKFIESLNDIRSDGRSIYIMNLISELKANFAEIDWIEYYGMNTSEDDYKMQRISSKTNEEISQLGYNEYVPEFINVRTVDNDGNESPQVIIHFIGQAKQ